MKDGAVELVESAEGAYPHLSEAILGKAVDLFVRDMVGEQQRLLPMAAHGLLRLARAGEQQRGCGEAGSDECAFHTIGY